MSSALQDPGSMVCALCGHTDYVTRGKLAPGIWQYSCSLHPNWELIIDGTKKTIPEWSGIMGELGLYEDLPKCVNAGEPFVEYGVVEYRFRTQFPTEWAKVRERYPYRTEGQHETYTASAFLAAALGRLGREGVLAQKFGRATGFWAYNVEVSYWAPVTSGADYGEDLTWGEFAEANGLDDHPPE